NQNVAGNVTASGNASVSGSLTIGNGTAITQHASIVVNPTFALLKPQKCSPPLPYTFVGAADGDVIALGVPNGKMSTDPSVILIYSAWVSQADTVSLQVCNLGSGPQKVAAFGAIRIDLWKH